MHQLIKEQATLQEIQGMYGVHFCKQIENCKGLLKKQTNKQTKNILLPKQTGNLDYATLLGI